MMIINHLRNVFTISICGLLFACASTNTSKVQNQLAEQASSDIPNSQFKQFSAAYYHLSSWKNLPNWNNDSFDQSWNAWQRSCQYFNKIKEPDWQHV